MGQVGLQVLGGSGAFTKQVNNGKNRSCMTYAPHGLPTGA